MNCLNYVDFADCVVPDTSFDDACCLQMRFPVICIKGSYILVFDNEMTDISYLSKLC